MYANVQAVLFIIAKRWKPKYHMIPFFLLSTAVKNDLKCFWTYKICVGITYYTLLWETFNVHR